VLTYREVAMTAVKNPDGKVDRLLSLRKRTAEAVPLEKMIRGTVLRRFLECARSSCRCHESTQSRHGPYYFLSVRKKDKSHHVYIPAKLYKEVKAWSANYDKAWKAIEKITDINTAIIRLKRQGDEKKRV
jgi:hypothetical protein